MPMESEPQSDWTQEGALSRNWSAERMDFFLGAFLWISLFAVLILLG